MTAHLAGGPSQQLDLPHVPFSVSLPRSLQRSNCAVLIGKQIALIGCILHFCEPE